MNSTSQAPRVLKTALDKITIPGLPEATHPGFADALIEHCASTYAARGWSAIATVSDGFMNIVAVPEKDVDPKEGQKAAGATGGIQGWKGTLFGVPYVAGSWQDKLIEAYGGTHDLIGGRLSGLYDEQGNIKRGISRAEVQALNTWSGIAIAPATPFAMSELLPPQVWQAFSIFLRAAN